MIYASCQSSQDSTAKIKYIHLIYAHAMITENKIINKHDIMIANNCMQTKYITLFYIMPNMK